MLELGGRLETNRQGRHSQKATYHARTVVLAYRLPTLGECQMLIRNAFSVVRTIVPAASFWDRMPALQRVKMMMRRAKKRHLGQKETQ